VAGQPESQTSLVSTPRFVGISTMFNHMQYVVHHGHGEHHVWRAVQPKCPSTLGIVRGMVKHKSTTSVERAGLVKPRSSLR
jgi:hypothetical protein